MDHRLEIGRGDWLKILNGPRLGNTERVLVEDSGRPFSWRNQIEFWSEKLKVNCSVKLMEIWSGGPNEDVAWFNRRVRS